MPAYKALYFKLFAAAADAVDAIDELRVDKAREILISVQQECEETIIEEDAE